MEEEYEKKSEFHNLPETSNNLGGELNEYWCDSDLKHKKIN